MRWLRRVQNWLLFMVGGESAKRIWSELCVKIMLVYTHLNGYRTPQ